MKGSKVKIRERAVEITRLLYRAYPDSHCSLNYKNAHELLVATILSAQCTDHRVNIVTKDLFLKYQSPQDFAYCDLSNYPGIFILVDTITRKQKAFGGPA
ncbi:MAG: hypothetical protein Ct9H300mP9_7260 [Candidatus Neomarinimicrobiota bacterium]|nr:MAG: hypothetical protein Ct9H300mP9_7260 [Candidatus Neomarinimicrobiota bacterium]